MKNIAYSEDMIPILIDEVENIEILKNEWPEFYYYLKRGHLSKGAKSSWLYISYEFSRYIKFENARIYSTQYFKDYNSVVNIFGKEKNLDEMGHLGYTIIYRYVETNSEMQGSYRLLEFGFDNDHQISVSGLGLY